MILVLIYGPPGVGKLTVAKELQKLTDYKLLHNHLIVNAIGSLFGYGNEVARDFNIKMRQMLYQAALREKLPGVISTFGFYGDKLSIDSISNYISLVRSYKGKILCVKLSCDLSILEKRVRSRNRKNTHKIVSVVKLRRAARKHPLFSQIPDSIIASLRIDNSHSKPEDVAQIIKQEIDKMI